MQGTLAPYRKFIMVVVGAVLTSLYSFYSDDILTAAEIMQTMFIAGGAGVAYGLPNAPGARYVKAFVMTAVVGLEILIAATESGQDYSTALWLNVAIAVVSSLGLIAVENAPEPAVPPTAALPPA